MRPGHQRVFDAAVDGVEPGDEFRSIAGPDHRAVAAYRAGGPQGPGDRRNLGGVGLQVARQRTRLGGHQIAGVCRDQHGDPAVGQGGRVVVQHGSAFFAGSAGSATPTIRCALVPLIPNADTEPIRRPSLAGQAVMVSASVMP